MRLLLLVNTSASSVTARGRVVIQKALSADHEVAMAETSRRGHATRLALGAAADGVEVVVALGGDGTLNEAANGLAGTDTALAVLPGGSTNVFARTIGLTNDPIEATGQLLGALARPASIRRIGLASLNGRYFLFNAGVGFDAAVIAQVERRSGLKRWAGHPLFVYAGFDTWFRHYDRSRPQLAVELPDGTAIGDGYFALVLNTDPYTFLGNRPLHIAPEATLDRGLAVATFRTLAFVPFIRIIGSALGVGRPVRAHRQLDLRTDLGTFRVRAVGGPLAYQVDGDYLGELTEAEFRHEPDVLRLVMPGA
ncbi:MAG: diacylglycerol kinase family protein [Acidimicrobiales bacterium]